MNVDINVPMQVLDWVLDGPGGGGLMVLWGLWGGDMRRKRHQTRSKIINRLSAEH